MNLSIRKIVFCFSLVLSQLVITAKLPADEPNVVVSATAPKSIAWYRPDKWQSLGSLGFRLAALPDDSIVMIFPEWITAREKSWHVPLEWTLDGERASGTWQEGPYSLELSLRFQQKNAASVLEWEYLFLNDSKTNLTDVAAFNCFNLVDAPTFKDLEMKRTWVGNSKKVSKNLDRVEKKKGPRTLQFYPASEGLELPEFERFARYKATSDQKLSGDRIGVISVDKKWSLQCIVEGPVAYFFNNWEADHGCVHAAPLFGDIAAGKTASAKGKIVFTLQE